jgi:hypothetical protein
LDSVRIAVSQSEVGIGDGNVQGRWTDGTLLTEEGISFGLYDPGSRGIRSHRIGAHNER